VNFAAAFITSDLLVFLMRATAIKLFGVVAVGTQNLESFRKIITNQPTVHRITSANLPAMLSPIIVDVVDLQELWCRLSAARTLVPSVPQNDSIANSSIMFSRTASTQLAISSAGYG
jgi:hypothetical protein